MSKATQSESEYLAFFDKGSKWFYSGCYVAAYEAFHETWVSAESPGADRLIRARSLWGAGTAAYQLGDVQTSLRCYDAAISFIDGEGLPAKLKLQALINMSIAYYWSGSFAKAVEVAREGQRLLGPDVEPKLTADLHLAMGGAAFYLDAESEMCLEANQRALDWYSEIKSADGQASALINLGWLCVRSGDHGQAYSHLQRALRLAARGRIPDTKASVCIELGLVHVRWKEPDRALRYGLAALEILWTNLAVLDKVELAKLSHLFGLIYRERGDSERALQQLQRASYYFTETRRWNDWEVVTRRMDELIANPQPFRRYEVNPRAVNRLRYFGALFELVDSIETMYPHVRIRSQVATHYALMLADRLGLPRKQRVLMSHAGRLHDVGMTAVDPEVVEQPAEMSDTGRRRLQMHVVVGENALRMFRLPEELYAAVRHHHENYDGSGYPDGLRDEQIPLPARILTLVDRYVELALHGRTWGDKGAANDMLARHDVAMSCLWQEAGSRLDPKLVALFDELHVSALSAVERESTTQEGSR